MWFSEGSINLMNSPEKLSQRDEGSIVNPFIALMTWWHTRQANVAQRKEEMLGYFPRAISFDELIELPEALWSMVNTERTKAKLQNEPSPVANDIISFFSATIDMHKNDDVWDIMRAFVSDINNRVFGSDNTVDRIERASGILESVIPSSFEVVDGPNAWSEHLHTIHAQRLTNQPAA